MKQYLDSKDIQEEDQVERCRREKYHKIETDLSEKIELTIRDALIICAFWFILRSIYFLFTTKNTKINQKLSLRVLRGKFLSCTIIYVVVYNLFL